MARPHVVVVPYPCAGNVNPALQIAKLLHHQSVYVTFINTEHNHRRVQATEGPGAVRGHDGFRFEAIPDGLSDADRRKQDYGRGLESGDGTSSVLTRLSCTPGPGVPPVSCVLTTMLMSFALDVARELRIPTMAFLTGSVASLMTHMVKKRTRYISLETHGSKYSGTWARLTPTHMRLRQLQERGYVALKDESLLTNGYLESTVIDWIPGMPPICLGDVSSFLRTTDPDDFCLRFNESEANRCTSAGALILNTFEGLEADVLAALRAEYPRVYTVGPLGTLLRRTLNGGGGGLSLWKQDAECVASSRGHPFLWAIRDNLIRGDGGGGGGGRRLLALDALPAGFTAETTGQCCLTPWCPQEEVLRHAAVGCFLTHGGGWNSVCESVAAGVPMVCWPGFADRFTNCKYACDMWGVGVRLDEEVRREQVATHVGEVMGSEEMRRRAARWKEEADSSAACAYPGGGSSSSCENLMSMVGGLMEKSTPNSEK
ncbi:hypothetical protein BDA96_04G130400 [Sorghum bicolor]|uniref:Glycosyltransferase n=1 Tax=Sorghum bicolor TaxID=4558 RepID=A0A921R2H1_SORBI|nr:hypothetical protein BDA96_04G130400 [Sorghum bicolor]